MKEKQQEKKKKQTDDGRIGTSEQQNETAPYILTPPGEAPRKVSAFSTVKKYNTKDRHTIASSDEIHNTDTNHNGNPYIELMFDGTAK